MREIRPTIEKARRRAVIIGKELPFWQRIKQGLEAKQVEVEVKNDTAEAIVSCVKEQFDVVLVDNEVENKGGLWLIGALREVNDNLKYVLIIKDEDEQTEVAAIKEKVDMILPDCKDEKVVLRYVEKLIKETDTSEPLVKKPKQEQVIFDAFRGAVVINGYEYQMTRKEFELVRFLVKHENEALSREYIYEQVWWGSFKNADPRTVDGCVKRIRMKIGFHYITSIRGYGYMWNTEGIY